MHCRFFCGKDGTIRGRCLGRASLWRIFERQEKKLEKWKNPIDTLIQKDYDGGGISKMGVEFQIS